MQHYSVFLIPKEKSRIELYLKEKKIKKKIINKKRHKKNYILEQRKRTNTYPTTLVWKMTEKCNRTIPEVTKHKTSLSASTEILVNLQDF